MAKESCDIGLIGLAVMGQNLVLNMNDHGYRVAVFNRTVSKVDEFINNEAEGTQVVGAHSIQELVQALKKPRRVMLMVKAGDTVDQMIDALLPHLEKGDIVIDGGNSHYHGHQSPHQGAGGKGHSVHRHRRFGRRGRRAPRPVHHAGRKSGRLAAREGNLPGHRGQGRGRHALLRLGGRERRRALREDGPQRHRVRRHAAHLRGLSAAEGRARA